MKKKIGVLITSYNRRSIAISCLEILFKIEIPDGYALEVFFVDDASSDGTKEEVIKKFPFVNVIDGNGELFWNRGMYTAWNYASKSFDFDFYLWLNDDTFLYDNSLEVLLNSSKSVNDDSIIVGTICSPTNSKIISYGGYDNYGRINPNGNMKECNTFNGNCVLIPKNIFKSIGNLDYYFSHSFGDIEYGLRAKKAGYKLYVTPEIIGECERNPWPPDYLNPKVKVLERFKIFYSPLGFHPRESFYLNRKYKTIFYAFILSIKLHINVLFPFILKEK